jgi:hypothetical protein
MNTAKEFLLICVFVCISTTTLASPPVGVIESVEPPAGVIRNSGSTTKAAQNTPLFPGDRIVTETGGRVEFRLSDGSRFVVDEDTEIVVDDLHTFSGGGNRRVISLVFGVLGANVPSGRNAPLLETPTTTVGVRGTAYDATVTIDGATAVAVDEGTVRLIMERSEASVTRNIRAVVEADDAAPALEPAAPKSRRNWRAWREEREAAFIAQLPQNIGVLKKRFERSERRVHRVASRIERTSRKIRVALAETAGEGNLARARPKDGSRLRSVPGKKTVAPTAPPKLDKNRFAVPAPKKRLLSKVDGYQRFVSGAGRGLKRQRVMNRWYNRLSARLPRYLDRIKPEDRSAVLRDMQAISQSRNRTREMIRRTLAVVGDTRRAIRKARLSPR